MQFFIEQLVLWPVDEKNKIHSLPFEKGKINIIHGRSGTGKSSIIAIIDYCLGASRCAIPVGIIRDFVDWFGLVVNISGKRFLVARRTPGSRQTSKEFFLKSIENELPKSLVTTDNEEKFKQKFNNLVRLTNLSLSVGDEISQFDGRPSYRDLAAFNFLPQHIVANPNTLFFKADSYEHKERLKRVMPFALGVIDSEYLIKERERKQLQKQYDDLVRQQEVHRRALTSWDAEVDRLWNQAVEIGLARIEDFETTEKKLSKLEEINSLFLSGDLETILQTPNYAHTNQKYKEVRALEENLQTKTDALRREIRGYEQLARRATDFTKAVELEQNRVVNLEWLKNHLSPNSECVICGSQTNQFHNVVSRLESQVNRVSELSQVLFENPIVDKEIEAAKSRLFDVQNQLQEARTSRVALEKIESATKDSLSRVYVLVGRIQALLIAFAVRNNTDDLGMRIKEIERKIQQLDTYFRQSGRAGREAKVDKELSELIEKYASDFELERRGTISLDKNELTLSFKRPSDTKKEFLWEVGSGANWMGYHIATFLAIHQFLSKDDLLHTPVFSFLVIDQPSQVYFPSANSGANQLDIDAEGFKKLKAERDVDIRATKRIFEMLEKGLRAANYRYQIIVLEHADSSIWGDVPQTKEVANWKSEAQGLIPSAWLSPT
jgi:energy-coupling factor transporter ATP-binding protein EcfA2